MDQTDTKPIHTITYGTLKACIFQGQSDYGKTYRTRIYRFYKDRENDQWGISNYFGICDLIVVQSLANAAHQFLLARTQGEDSEIKLPRIVNEEPPTSDDVC